MAKRRSERARLTDKLDGLCREIVRITFNRRCCRCGKHIQGCDSHPSHIVAKGNGASLRRWDLLNIKLLCFHCHRWWHDNPTESGPWFAEKYPAREAYLGIYRNGKPAKITTPDMRDLAVVLRNKLADLIKETKQ